MTKILMLKATTSFMKILQVKLSNISLFKTWLYSLCVATAMLFVVSCDQIPGETGLEVLPDDDLIGLKYTDTLSIKMETQIRDRVRTGKSPWQLMGNYFDPAFGRISAATYTQMLIPGADLEFGEDLEFVGLRLDLDILGVYGTFNSPMKLGIYELDESISDDDSVLQSDHPPLATRGPELSGRYEIDFSEANTFGDLQIPLSKDLGERILFADSADLATNAAFISFFKGLVIKSEDVGFTTREPGAIFNVFLNSSASSLTLIYKRKGDDGGRVLDSLEFVINSSARKFHTITRSHVNGLVFEQYGQTQPPANGQDLYEFLQAGSLVRTFVQIPALGNFPLIGVNRAELTLKVDNTFFGSGSRYAPPENILFFLADENQNFLRGDNGGITIFSGAAFNQDSSAYILNMTSQAQLIISERRENFGFIIMPDDSANSLNRAVFGGVDHPVLKPTFRLTYTELPR